MRLSRELSQMRHALEEYHAAEKAYQKTLAEQDALNRRKVFICSIVSCAIGFAVGGLIVFAVGLLFH